MDTVAMTMVANSDTVIWIPEDTVTEENKEQILTFITARANSTQIFQCSIFTTFSQEVFFIARDFSLIYNFS